MPDFDAVINNKNNNFFILKLLLESIITHRHRDPTGSDCKFAGNMAAPDKWRMNELRSACLGLQGIQMTPGCLSVRHRRAG